MSARRSRAFSLLEVLFAVALFGAIVTFILSAEAGLVAGDKTAANMSQAAELARCRMSELEEEQLRLGFPEIEEKDTSPRCCADTEVAGFSCDWRRMWPRPEPRLSISTQSARNLVRSRNPLPPAARHPAA